MVQPLDESKIGLDKLVLYRIIRYKTEYEGVLMNRYHEAEMAIKTTIQTVNEICKQGKGFERLKSLFHKDVVIVWPRFTAQAEGREVCWKSYEDTCSQMTFHKLDASDEKIAVFGDTAVACYKYDCVWDYKDKQFEDDGHEIQVFVKEGPQWQLAWRTLIPGPRQVETCPTEEETSNESQDIRDVCLDLMATASVCDLTTIDADGFPHTTAMNNLRCVKEYPSLKELYEGRDNGFLLYLSTSMQSDKMGRIRANPKVSAFFSVPDRFIGLMLGGKIELILDQALKNKIWQPGWTMYYPNGPEGPEYGVLRLAPTVAKGWFQGRPFEFNLESKESKIK